MIRHSAGFEPAEEHLLEAYATPGTPQHEALTRSLPGLEVASTSSAIRALVLVGHRSIQGDEMQRAYDRAVAAGEFDAEAEDWYRAAASGILASWSAD